MTATALTYTLIGLLTACLFIYIASRHLLLSAIFGTATMAFYLAAYVVQTGVEATATLIASSVIYLAAFFLMAVMLGTSLGMREEPARFSSVLVALLTIIVFYSVYYVSKSIPLMGGDLALASAISVIFALLLERDLVKMGMSLLMGINFLHLYVPEPFEPIASAVAFACIVTVGVIVYYAYKEFGTKNVDVLMKLRY